MRRGAAGFWVVLVCLVAALAMVGQLQASADAQPGSADPSFIESVSGNGFDDFVETTAVSADGKILVGGWFSQFNNAVTGQLVRLNADGSRDWSFNPDGKGFSRPAKLAASIETIALEPDGKILVGGYFSGYGGTEVANLTRLLPDGQVDPTFAKSGLGRDDVVQDLAVLPDGKILVGGSFTSFNGHSAPGLVRLNPDGTRDASFVVQAEVFPDAIYALDVQPDQKILAAGSFANLQGGALGQVVRLKPDGSRDQSFALAQWSSGPAMEVRAQSDGAILVGAFNDDFQKESPILVRLNADGSSDQSFPTVFGTTWQFVDALEFMANGQFVAGGDISTSDHQTFTRVARFNLDGTRDASYIHGAGFDQSVHSVMRMPDGSLIVGGGFYTFDGQRANGLARLTGDGSLDTTFALGGSTPVTLDHVVGAMALQPDGKVIVGGYFHRYDSHVSPSLARVNPDGTFDGSFRLPGSGFNADVRAIAVQPDGKVLVGGDFNEFDGARAAYLVRLNSDGTPDAAFHARLDDSVQSLALQPDGKIVVGGDFTRCDGQLASHLARLNADGSRDPSFLQTGAGLDERVEAVIVAPDARIVVGGWFGRYDAEPVHGVARLHTDGTLDETFGKDVQGIVGVVSTLAQQSDGKILAGGLFQRHDDVAAHNLTRLTTSGKRDPTFRQTGTGLDEAVESLAVQPDGRIVVGGGFTHYDGQPAAGLTRLDPDGRRDPSFVQVGRGFDQRVRSVLLQPDAAILVGGEFTAYGAAHFAFVTRLFGGGPPVPPPPPDPSPDASPQPSVDPPTPLPPPTTQTPGDPKPSPSITSGPDRPLVVMGLRVSARQRVVRASWSGGGASEYTVRLKGRKPTTKVVGRTVTTTRPSARIRIRLRPDSRATVCVTAHAEGRLSAPTCRTARVR